VIVYVTHQNGIERVTDELQKNNISHEAIHGKVPEETKTRILSEFAEGKCNVLVSCLFPSQDFFIVHSYDTFVYLDQPKDEATYISTLKELSVKLDIRIVSIVNKGEVGTWSKTMERYGMRLIQCKI
jgi:hypothetical protein